MTRSYLYVGPPELLSRLETENTKGTVIGSQQDLTRWLGETQQETDGTGLFWVTYVVDCDEALRIADRRSEHVHCAGGGEVLAAGELGFAKDLELIECSNLSTGYCPEPECYPTLEKALAKTDILWTGEGLTKTVVFRLCSECGQRCIVKDAWFVCADCDGQLPKDWNFQN